MESKFHWRRPGFLSHLPEEQYKKAFNALKDYPLAIQSAKQMVDELKNVGPIMSVLCQVAIFMVDPTWKLPAGSQKAELDNTDFMTVIAERCLALPPLRGPGMPHGQGVDLAVYQAAVKSNMETAVNFLLELREYVAGTKGMWDKIVRFPLIHIC
jgi:hypothetical protein